MTGLESTLIGAIASASTGIIGYLFGASGKMTRDEFKEVCKKNQMICSTHVCDELKHIKKDIEEIKRLLNRN